MRTFLFVMFLLLSQPTAILQNFNFVVWNVGQGSWSTWIDRSSCFHFDMGGDRVNIEEVTDLCRHKSNWLLLSHDDWDHINAIKKFHGKVKGLCLYFPKPTRYRFLNKLKVCPKLPKAIDVISMGTGNTGNNSSLVYLLGKQVLLPGDAPKSQEKKWLKHLPHQIQGLVLGHHGSYTSTSMALLARTRPRWAVASCRKKKYGHPHHKVINKLKKQRVPLLTTETLGNLYFNLNF